MNLLFLGGAKRVSMARKFKAAAARMGSEAKIYAYELTREVPIALEAEEVIPGRRWADPELDAHLREVVRSRGIDAVIPFVDGAVAVAARLSDVCFAPCCSPEQAEVMFDKVLSDRLFRDLSLPVPRAYSPGTLGRFIAKPRRGSASKGLVEFRDVCPLPDPADYLIQELIEPRREITVDCYVEPASGRILAAVPRERLEVAGGEVVRTRTFHRPEVSDLARRVLTVTGLRGAVTVQFIEDLTDGRLMVMEINPRLGGGAVCAVGAGVDIPAMILRNAAGLPAEAAEDYADVLMARYSDEIFFKQ